LQRAFHALAVVSYLAALLLAGWNAWSADGIAAIKGETYYTQFSLFHLKNVWLTTNYRKGVLVPVNTQVTFLKASSKEITVKLLDGGTLKIVNVERYSGVNVEGVFNRTFEKEKVDLAKFSTAEKEDIMAGTVSVGMSKDAVIKALGYPPEHKTPNLEGNKWRYWKNRYGTMLVSFTDGKVSDIKK
jgi:hypothetical protein